MRKLTGAFLISIIFLSTGCFEIVEEIKYKSDGSGSFSYLVNMSQSRDKIRAILSLDSASGLRVPSQKDIADRIEIGRSTVAEVSGINNVKVGANYNDYIFSISFDFDSLDAMNNAAALLHRELSPYGKVYRQIFTPSADGFKRHADSHTTAFLDNLNRKNPSMLKPARYTTVYRFDRPVSSADKHAKIAGNKMAVMYQKSVYEIANNPALLEQSITFNQK